MGSNRSTQPKAAGGRGPWELGPGPARIQREPKHQLPSLHTGGLHGLPQRDFYKEGNWFYQIKAGWGMQNTGSLQGMDKSRYPWESQPLPRPPPSAARLMDAREPAVPGTKPQAEVGTTRDAVASEYPPGVHHSTTIPCSSEVSVRYHQGPGSPQILRKQPQAACSGNRRPETLATPAA